MLHNLRNLESSAWAYRHLCDCQALLCHWRDVECYCTWCTVRHARLHHYRSELTVMFIMEYRILMMVVGLQFQPSIKRYWRILSTRKKKVGDSFVEVSTSGIELQILCLMGLPMWWMGLKIVYNLQKDVWLEVSMRTHLWIDLLDSTNQEANN